MLKNITNIHKIFNRFDIWLIVIVILGLILRVRRLGDFDNEYYTATVSSMLQNANNFFFASFDTHGIVTVDKPPVSFWIQSIVGGLFGVNGWSVSLPQVIAGILAIVLLYITIRPTFGRIAAILGSLTLAVIPASVVIDSGNEPDSLLSLILLLAAFCMIRNVKTNHKKWLIAFSLMIGIGFNIKMLVAFVPLPAFLIYQILSTNTKIKLVAKKTILGIAMLLVISFSWMTIVSATPSENRPYIGSTKNNSIWTLAFIYNGLDRFTSFIGPRPQNPSQVSGFNQPGLPTPPQQAGLNQPGLPTPQYPPFQNNLRNIMPSQISPDQLDTGIIGLLNRSLASQIGWLLPLGIFNLLVLSLPLLSEQVYKRPVSLFKLIRESPKASEGILWIVWLTTSAIIFGSANSTTTHPYYLVGMAVPLAAVIGIGLSVLFETFRDGKSKSWFLPIALIGCGIYQIYGSNEVIKEWAITVVFLTLVPSIFLMSIAIYKKTTIEPLASLAVGIGVISVLIIPVVTSITAGGRIVGPNILLNRPVMIPPQINKKSDLVEIISTYLTEQAKPESSFTIATVNARNASPFILSGIPAIAIGGFSGSDPIFSIDSFQSIIKSKNVKYFLMPELNNTRGMGTAFVTTGYARQEHILNFVRLTWEEVSLPGNLPSGTLYKYPDQN